MPLPTVPDNLSVTWGHIVNQEVVGRQALPEGGLEVRPTVLARFSDQDHREFDGSYSRLYHWARLRDQSGLLNDVAPDLNQLEKQLALVESSFRRVRECKV